MGESDNEVIFVDPLACGRIKRADLLNGVFARQPAKMSHSAFHISIFSRLTLSTPFARSSLTAFPNAPLATFEQIDPFILVTP